MRYYTTAEIDACPHIYCNVRTSTGTADSASAIAQSPAKDCTTQYNAEGPEDGRGIDGTSFTTGGPSDSNSNGDPVITTYFCVVFFSLLSFQIVRDILRSTSGMKEEPHRYVN